MAVFLASTAVSIASPPRAAFVYGDSLAQGSAPYLVADLPGWELRQSAALSRHVAEAEGALLRQGARLEPVVVLSVGTNDDPRAVGLFDREVRALVAIAGPHRCVVWPNIVRPPAVGTSYAGFDRVLAEEAVRLPTLRIVDWASLVRRHRGWLTRDGVHPNAAGYRARAAAIADAVRGCWESLR
jgi:lysophospholipase L1-like esterase